MDVCNTLLAVLRKAGYCQYSQYLVGTVGYKTKVEHGCHELRVLIWKVRIATKEGKKKMSP